MENNSRDDSLKKNYIQKYQFLIKEYEQVKAKKHPQHTKVKDFYAAHGTCPQTFLKYYADISKVVAMQSHWYLKNVVQYIKHAEPQKK